MSKYHDVKQVCDIAGVGRQTRGVVGSTGLTEEGTSVNAEGPEEELLTYFHALHEKARSLQRDSEWTRLINTDIAEIGRRRGFLVFASRCDSTVDGPEWLYDHHWRQVNERGDLVRIPLVMEIEWGFGKKTIREKVAEDYLKLVQSRAELKVMVFAGDDVQAMMNELERMARAFEDKGPADRLILVSYDWDVHEMDCRSVCV